MARFVHLLLLVSFVLASGASAAMAAGGGHRRGRSSARLQLERAAPGASLADRAADDRLRHAHISSKLAAAAASSTRRRAAETSPAESSAFAMPLTSGAYTGTGQYFVRFRVGTPAQPFVLVADTGSDLTWVKCRGPSSSSSPAPAGSPPPQRVFRPAASKSWAPIPCDSDTCKSYVPFSLANCSSPPGPCSYDYRYKDNSSARGVVGLDSATVSLSGDGRKAKLQELVLGCTTSYDGQSFKSSDGVLSLGNSNISFASRAASRFGGRFSYCLVDHLAPRNATSFLTFGSGGSPGGSSSRTPLLLLEDARTRPFYFVSVDAVAVAGERLDILPDVWDFRKNGGAILDSGTSLTILATPAYKAVMEAITKQFAGLPRVSMDPFEYCYDWTGVSAAGIPRMEVTFAGAATLAPPGKSYVIDVAPGVKCVGVLEGAWPGVSVIGNILQQEHLWEFDLANRWLRFKQSRCAQ